MTGPALPHGAQIHTVDDPAGCRRAVTVLAATWGHPTTYPAEILQVVAEYGGYVAVVSVDGTDVGASFGIVAADGHLHSHITGVVAPAAGRGFGQALKHHQRTWAADRGMDRITWTFDPLVRRNAAFNLVTLGARVTGYRVDLYGPLRDAINAGDETDRLVVEWPTTGELSTGTVVVPAGSPRITTPADIEHLRIADPPAARRWRFELRESFEQALRHHRVLGLDAEGSYVFEGSTRGGSP